jgi:hypothetical protein
VAFAAMTAWSLVSIAAQVLRFGQALARSSDGRIVNWMA